MPTPGQQRRASQREFQSKVIFAVLLMLFAWVLLEYTSLLYKSYQIELKKQWFVEENRRLVENNRELEKRYEYYKTDYFFRKEAKRKLNRREPGEQVIIITGGDERIFSPVSGDSSDLIWERWREYLFSPELPDRLYDRKSSSL